MDLLRQLAADSADITEFLHYAEQQVPDARDLGEALWILLRDHEISSNSDPRWVHYLSQAPEGAFHADDVENFLNQAKHDPWSMDFERMFDKLGPAAQKVVGHMTTQEMTAAIAFYQCRRGFLPWSMLNETNIERIAEAMFEGSLLPWLTHWRTQAGDAQVGRALAAVSAKSKAPVENVQLANFVMPFATDEEIVQIALRSTGPIARRVIGAQPERSEAIFKLLEGQKVDTLQRFIGVRPIEALMGATGLIGPLGAVGLILSSVVYMVVGPISLTAFFTLTIMFFLGLRGALVRPTPATYPPKRIDAEALTRDAAAEIAGWVKRHGQFRNVKLDPGWDLLSKREITNAPQATGDQLLAFVPEGLFNIEPSQGLHHYLDTRLSEIAADEIQGHGLRWASGDAVSDSAAGVLYALLTQEARSHHRPQLVPICRHLDPASRQRLREATVNGAWGWPDAALATEAQIHEVALQTPGRQFVEMLSRRELTEAVEYIAYCLATGDPEQRSTAYGVLKSKFDDIGDGIENALARGYVQGGEVRDRVAETFMTESKAAQRRWLPARWRRVFQSDAFRGFAGRVVWGVYDGYGQLSRAFRVDESMELLDIDDETFTIPPHHTVGLVASTDISADQHQQWTERFVEYEIVGIPAPDDVFHEQLKSWSESHVTLSQNAVQRILNDGWWVSDDSDVEESLTLMRPFVLAGCTVVIELEHTDSGYEIDGGAVIDGVHFRYPLLANKVDPNDRRNGLQSWAWIELRECVERA